MPVRINHSSESVSRSSESISGSGSSSAHHLPGLGLEAEGSWNSHVLAGDTMLFAAPSLESLYIIDSFEEPLNELEVTHERAISDPALSPLPSRRGGKRGKGKQHTSFFGSWFGGSGSHSKDSDMSASEDEDDLALSRRPSCDILLYTAPATLLPSDDSHDDKGATTPLIAPACEPDSAPGQWGKQKSALAATAPTIATSTPASPSVRMAKRSGIDTSHITEREVILSRDDRSHSFGMYLRATRDGRVLVTGVDPDTPASRSEVEVGDELVVVNGFCVKRCVCACVV